MTTPIAPDGFVVVEVVSSYYGSHSELGEGDEVMYLAVPTQAYDSTVEYETSHGSFGSQPIEPCPPAGSQLYDGELFRPFNVEANQARIERDKEANSYWD
jgi:hypothetical protein